MSYVSEFKKALNDQRDEIYNTSGILFVPVLSVALILGILWTGFTLTNTITPVIISVILSIILYFAGIKWFKSYQKKKK